MPGSAAPAESFTLKMSVVEALKASELLPLTVIVVPVTSMLLLAETPSTVTVTVMVRFVLFAPIFSLAVTMPFVSETPPALMLLMNAVGSLPVANVTVLPARACRLTSSTTAVKSRVVEPAEPICEFDASNCTVAAVWTTVVVVVVVVLLLPPPPQPARTVAIAARKSFNADLETSSFKNPRIEKFCTQASPSLSSTN